MRKSLLFVLLLVYALSSTGATISLHFCCGKLDSVSLSAPMKDKCGKPGMGISKEHCCDNKHVELKLKADQEPAYKWAQTQKLVSTPVITPLYLEPVPVPAEPLYQLPNGPPVRSSLLPLFIKHRVFRI
jgi:hypothetical protein